MPSARKTSSGLNTINIFFRDSTKFFHHPNLLRDSQFFYQPNRHFPQSTFTSGLHLGQKNKSIQLDIRAQFEQLSTSKKTLFEQPLYRVTSFERNLTVLLRKNTATPKTNIPCSLCEHTTVLAVLGRPFWVHLSPLGLNGTSGTHWSGANHL